MEVHIPCKRDRYRSDRFDPLDEPGIQQGTMLDAETRIAARRFLLQALENRQHAIDGEVPVRMHADLPTCQMCLSSRVVQILRRRRLQASEFGHVLVRL